MFSLLQAPFWDLRAWSDPWLVLPHLSFWLFFPLFFLWRRDTSDDDQASSRTLPCFFLVCGWLFFFFGFFFCRSPTPRARLRELKDPQNMIPPLLPFRLHDQPISSHRNPSFRTPERPPPLSIIHGYSAFMRWEDAHKHRFHLNHVHPPSPLPSLSRRHTPGYLHPFFS